MSAESPTLDVVNFDGIVTTMDWITMPDGRNYKHFRGRVTCMSAENAVGFTPTGHNTANWLARIQGPFTSINLMGCQVRTVLEGDSAALDRVGVVDLYVVP